MEKVIVFGTGAFAQVAHFYLTKDSLHEVVAFTADEKFIQEKNLLGLPVIPFEEIEKIHPPEKFKMFIAIGYRNVNKLRAEKYNEAKGKGYELITYVNSEVRLWGDTEMGDNCFILERQTIQPFVTIGSDVIIWGGGFIGHHSVIGNHCYISPHVAISGYVKIEPYCFLGVNATIRDGITIASECVIGAGTVILKDTKEKSVYVGKAAEVYLNDSSKLRRI